jgi:hypothetical protein
VSAVALAVSCTERRTSVAPTDPQSIERRVTSLAIAPAETTIEVGRTALLTVTPLPVQATVTPSWSSSATSVAEVSAAGLVTAVAAGKTTISATAGAVTGRAVVTVTDPVVVAAGDIASCLTSGDEATAALLDAIPGTVITLGDNVYDNGTLGEYNDCYGPSWGRHKARTRPSPGNHEYNTANATGYFEYFGAAAGDPAKGYHSYDIGAWHVIVLNSSLGCTPIGCAPGSPQEQWLRADLAAHANVCTLAYWHHPRFNSGASHGDYPPVGPFWDALYEHGADVVLNGHDHVYERFAPQTPGAAADPARGIRQFTAGTGGRGLYSFGTIKPNSEVRQSNTLGVLKLTLRATSYDWEFVPVAGGTFADSGTGQCH